MTRIIRRRTRSLGLLAALACIALPAAAEDLEVPLSRPGDPVELVASGLAAVFVIEGHDAQTVKIEISAIEEPDFGFSTGGPGMRQLQGAGLGLSVVEEDNRVRVKTEGDNPRQVRIWVPRATSVHASSVNGGDITVRGVSGEHELKNVNGGVTAIDLAGSLKAHTTNGDLSISMSRIEPGTPLSFVTFNGDIDVTFPSGLAADVELRSDFGEVFTDFDVTVVPTPAEETAERTDGRYRVAVRKPLVATIGGGGTEVELRTHNGDIHLRKGS